MSTNVVFNFLGILLFVFLFWKRLREDYSSQIIFTSCFYVLLGLGVFYFLSFKFYQQAWFWFSFLGIAIGFSFGILKFHFRIYETMESLIISLFPWLSLVFLSDSVNNYSAYSFAVFIFCLVLIFAFYFLDTHYKDFSWYRSGKIGLAGLATLGFFFLTRVAIAITSFKVLSFIVPYDVYLSGIVAFVCLVLIVSLAVK